ncbi:hypothetical protein EVJ58_g7497 [Rhodofomes roseus]|uniref:Uncharacterized protein n=1 Tax=Rhodofomes roseus TaxID=34475 RepID=A0A4Y9Y4Z9_9APHY|nr:hypothetical protein EVJ58_g7497 [Rhodofomes roseus]
MSHHSLDSDSALDEAARQIGPDAHRWYNTPSTPAEQYVPILPQSALKRICCFEVYRRFADGRVVQSQCGVEIRGDDANGVTREFEMHLASDHPPQIRQEPQGTQVVSVSNCNWLYPDGTICSQVIKVHSDAKRPCYALAQHVGKKTDHFALHLARCQREDCGCNKDFASYDALARHHKRVDERLNTPRK